jgi:hypothetical protein
VNGTRICLRKFIVRCARNPDGREFLDLEFNIRPGSYSSKWIDCIRSVEHLPPHQYGFPKWLEHDAGVYEQRIADALNNNTDIQEFLLDSNIDRIVINQDLVNAVHRYIEHNHQHAAEHLVLHNDIHYLESIWEGATDVVFKKLQWVPPGLMIDMTLDDYKEFTTEPCTNFIQDDFSHVGRSPHNSYLYQDDSSLYTSCVIQHKVGSGAKWFIPDDSHIFKDERGFRSWVSEHQAFFKKQWAIETNTDPRLCHGRIIIAEGVEDYSRIDRSFDFVVKAFII